MRNHRRPFVTLLALGCLGTLGLGCNRQGPVEIAPPASPAKAQAAPGENPTVVEKEASKQPPKTPEQVAAVKKVSLGQGEKGKGGPPAKAPAGPGGEGFTFPKDKAGKLTGNLLRPGEVSSRENPSGPKRPPGSSTFDRIEVPLSTYQGGLPRVTVKKTSKLTQPPPVPEEVPLGDSRSEPEPPQAKKLPAGERVRLYSPDPTKPVPLPPLSKPLTDRASLEDPTGEASLAAALAERIPLRTVPAPFAPLTLPDPFENSQAARLRTPPEESPDPPIDFPRTPRK